MPVFKRDDVELYYEEHGAGFPVLLIAPGGMRSAVSFWERTPWNPIDQLAPHYRVIAMDQRNAGKSVAPVRPTDSWHVYTADQLALLDHLGIDRFRPSVWTTIARPFSRCSTAGRMSSGPRALM